MEAPELSVVTALDAPPEEEVASLLEQAAEGSGHAPLSEHKLMTLRRALDPAVTATGTEFVGAVVARSGTRRGLVGFAPVVGDPTGRTYAFEVALAPGSSPGPATDLRGLMADAAVGLVGRSGGGALRWWSSNVSADDDALAVAHGFHIERSLMQMRCPLPLPRRGDRGEDRGVATRPFRPGADEDAWLVTNNRAFASHPEQGGWDLATLMEREREPWFDPNGFLLLEAEGRLAGSCWTKIHSATDPPMGEIYVIGVDPDFHGRGWGRALTEAGLHWLAGQGLAVGMLYVDADNVAAMSLYRSMGFVEHHVDRAYLIDVD